MIITGDDERRDGDNEEGCDMIFDQPETQYISQRSGSNNRQLFKQMAGGTQGTIVTSQLLQTDLTSLSKSSMTVVAAPGLLLTTTPGQTSKEARRGDDEEEDVSSLHNQLKSATRSVNSSVGAASSVRSCQIDTAQKVVNDDNSARI